MGGIALSFAPDRPIRVSYFEEMEVASPEPEETPAASEFTGETDWLVKGAVAEPSDTRSGWTRRTPPKTCKATNGRQLGS